MDTKSEHQKGNDNQESLVQKVVKTVFFFHSGKHFHLESNVNSFMGQRWLQKSIDGKNACYVNGMVIHNGKSTQ